MTEGTPLVAPEGDYSLERKLNAYKIDFVGVYLYTCHIYQRFQSNNQPGITVKTDNVSRNIFTGG